MFNKGARLKNALKLSTVNTVCYVVGLLANMFYRMMFVRYMAINYLGINGLFANVLQVLALADLGIIQCINFRFYEPIHNSDVKRVGQLLNYMKEIYRIVAAVIFVAGLLFLPFIHLVIKDTAEIPSDINLNLVYILFLLNSVASYCFSYSQSLLVADQRGYERGIYGACVNIICIALKLLIICYTRNYTLMLGATVLLTLMSSYILHRYVKNSYKAVFEITEKLPKPEQRNILKEARNVLAHKLGGVVQNGTDNILITYFSGLISCGLFSNYSILFFSMENFTGGLIKSFSASIGNAKAALDNREFFTIYRRIHLINYYISGLCTTCMFALAADFIRLWLGERFLLNDLVLSCLCLNYYIINSRSCNWSFIDVTGLITKDLMRPLLSVSINLVASIALGKYMGIPGVIFGTIISNICAVLWREVRLLYREIFVEESLTRYWLVYLKNGLITVMAMYCSRELVMLLSKTGVNIFLWLAEGFLCCIIYTVIFCTLHYSQVGDLVIYLRAHIKKDKTSI